MQSEISVFLSHSEQDVRVRNGKSLGGRTWLSVRCEEGSSGSELTVFGTPAQLDAFIDRITALRSTQYPPKVINALRRALGMPEDSTDLEVLLKASLTDDAHSARESTPALSQSEAQAHG